MFLKKSGSFFISFILLFFFLNDSILFNEEFLICFSLILIFYIIYKALHKSIILIFILDIEHLYLSLTYLLKLNISLSNKLIEFLNIFLNLLKPITLFKPSDLKYIYMKVLSKKLLKFERCLFLLDNTKFARKEFWVTEGLKLFIKKNIIPVKAYSFLKLNNILAISKNNENVYEKIFFYIQFLQIFYFLQFIFTFSKFTKIYKNLC